MPVLKSEILGTKIDIKYQDGQLEKLSKLIESSKKRLNEFPNNERISNLGLMFLSAIKIEDELEELTEVNQNDKLIIKEHLSNIKKLNHEISCLKNDLNKLKIQNESYTNLDLKNVTEVDILKLQIDSLKEKIRSAF